MYRALIRNTIRRLGSSTVLHSQPPSHFSNPNEIPPTYNTYYNRNNSIEESNKYKVDPYKQSQQVQPSSSSSSSQSHEGSFKEITTLIAMLALAYIAIDNYTSRIKIEKLHQETTAINLKALQIQQLNYQKDKKARDLQILKERKEVAKRSFKMSLHIAMLRKQLKELGVDPIELDKVVNEFEKTVKVDNSMKNVSGQYLWIDDSSEYKNELPDPMEYDKIRKP
ncbi:unnamed protein product [Candida verbasci]|uniref:Uncharacterized protein n=1 Tax=Candida verbasci TaxID=1227364 RepID=A0A9W4TU03_9ASCO|nr:unnamed protein product [Candida verbasci]